MAPLGSRSLEGSLKRYSGDSTLGESLGRHARVRPLLRREAGGEVVRHADGYGERWAVMPCPHPMAPVLIPKIQRCHADAIELCLEGLDKFTTEKDVAQFVRKSFVDKVRPQSRCPQTDE